jgi:TATA-binding protein-associated factor Taf7
MKRIFAVIILFAAGITAFAQQDNRTSSRPTPEQTKENMKQYLEQGKSKASQFDSTQADLKARNTGNDEERRFKKLKTEIEGLESSIRLEQYKISNALEKGLTVSRETLDNVGRMLDKHKEKLAELDYVSSVSSSAE